MSQELTYSVQHLTDLTLYLYSSMRFLGSWYPRCLLHQASLGQDEPCCTQGVCSTNLYWSATQCQCVSTVYYLCCTSSRHFVKSLPTHLSFIGSLFTFMEKGTHNNWYIHSQLARQDENSFLFGVYGMVINKAWAITWNETINLYELDILAMADSHLYSLAKKTDFMT